MNLDLSNVQGWSQIILVRIHKEDGMKMKSGLAYECCLIMQAFFLLFISGCSSSTYSPGEKASAVSSEDASQDIFNVLNDYPALEASFTSGTLSRKTFEDKLFKGLLGNPHNADMIVSILDGLPPLFEPRTVPEEVFEEGVEEEMNRKGPLPDLFSALATLPRFIMTLPEDQKEAFYAFLDLPSSPGSSSTSSYVRKILLDFSSYLTTCDPNSINTVMDLMIGDLCAMQAPQAQTLDLTDIDDEIGKITAQAPDGLAEMLHGSRDLLMQPAIQTSLTDSFSGIGRLLADTKLYPKTKTMLTTLASSYNKQTLGALLERVWTKGPVPGASIEVMAVEGYGKSGKYDCNLRELLTQPAVLNSFIETISSFDRAGFHFDGVDKQVREYVLRDPFLQLRTGNGEFGGGIFYSPTSDFSYKNYTGLQGFIDYSTRWSVPLTLTASFMFENRASGAATQAAIRKMIPTADSIPVAALIWTEIYEKGAGYTYGHGHPVTEKRGYGMMKDGVFVAPNAPDTISGAAMALTQVGDALQNGPYDNIYDNMRWLLHERKFYTTIDLVQFVRRIPLLDAPCTAYFKTFGIESMPMVLFTMQGINSLMYMDLDTLLNAITTQVNLTSIPASLKSQIADVMAQMMGSSAPGTEKTFILPQDMRDLWTMVLSLGYYDPAAFHPDRFLNTGNSAEYSLYYDITKYTYASNIDKANPIWPLIGALSTGSYIQYRAVVDQYEPSLENLEARKAAAKKAFGGVEIPIQYVINLIAPLTEQALEKSAYSMSDTQVKLLKLLIPFFETDSSGTIDAIFKLVCTLGKPEMRTTRLRLLNGLAQVVATTKPNSSDGPYALAGEMLSTPSKALTDPRYWDALQWKLNAGAALLSPNYSVVENLKGLLSSSSASDLSVDDKAFLARGLTDILGRLSEDRFFSRCLIDLTDIMKHLNSTHSWGDMAGVMRDSLKEDGIVAYLMDGLKKASRYTWDQILNDVDRFLHSDLIMRYDAGSFWDAVKSLINFLVQAID